MSNLVVAAALSRASSGDPDGAATMLAEAVDNGDRDAMWQLAVWRIAGSPIARDLVAGRSLLRRAADLGHIDAAHMEISLAANGSGGPVDWPGARSRLNELAVYDPFAAEAKHLLEAMTLDVDGRPGHLPTPELLNTNPHIWRVARLFTVAECQHVANVAINMLAPAMVVDPRTGRSIPHPIRTSHSAVIGPTHETLVVQALNRRIAAVTSTDWRQGEALTVLRYEPGQQFRPHYDAIGGARNQRVRTMLVYLNEAFEGGETSFSVPNLLVKPCAGDAIFFDNILPDGRTDPTSRHAGEAVRRGVKWLATRWIRERAFDPWLGPESV